MITILRELKEKILLACGAGFVLYGFLNYLAMIYYPGGTYIDKDRVGYSFSENFFSDLGMSMTYSGGTNARSRWLFAVALDLVGVVLIAFFLLMVNYFKESKLERNLSRIGTAAGVVAGISCIGIAATPWDRYLDTHMLFVYLLSLSLMVIMISYSTVIINKKSYPDSCAWVFGVYALVLVAYLVLMMTSPDVSTASGLKIMAIGQKVVIYLGMLCLFIQVVGAYTYNRRVMGRDKDD